MTEQQDDERMFGKVEQFIHFIKQQQLSPHIRPFQTKLFEEIKQELTEQQSRIKEYIRGSQDNDANELFEKNFKYLMYNAEKEKITYLLKLYLRIRLMKIQKYCFYLAKNPVIVEKTLSASEKVFANDYARMKYNYFSDNVLSIMHKNFRGLAGMEVLFHGKTSPKLYVDSKQSKIEIIEPNIEYYCFTRILVNPNELRYNLDIKAKNMPEEYSEVVSAGDIIYGPYRQVRSLVESEHAILM